MSPVIAMLAKHIPVPQHPIDTAVSPIRFQLPDDYLEFGSVFGSGTLSVGVYEWDIFSPYRQNYAQFVEQFSRIWMDVREALEMHHLPLGLHPEPGGMIPFGVDANGVWLALKPSLEGEGWKTVILYSYEDDEYMVYDAGFAEFLTGLVTRVLQYDFYPEVWDPSSDISYSPGIQHTIP